MQINNSYLIPSEFRPSPLSINTTSQTTTTATSSSTHHNSRKKRTKFMRINAGELARPTTKKPDSTAPKITRPCTECGKKFWSWKALFGHMRCHPERQWRGINPPPNFKRLPEMEEEEYTEEDHEVAACLLMLANGPAASEYSEHNCGRFECSSCKKVFGSHQALGGHRASHKNVKGCYAITKNDGEEDGCCSGEIINNNGHKCSICLRVFSSGQALGGHMRCHWEKVEEEPSRGCGFDLNLIAPIQDDDDDDAFSCYSYHQALDLRLGL